MSTKPPAPNPDKPEINWVQIESDFRAGIKPLRTIAEQHGISHTAIQKRAKREDWSRDLNHRIQAKAAEMVAKHEVAKRVAKASGLETETVLVNAKAVYDVRIGHRTLAGRAINLTTVMLGDLEAVSSPEGQGLVETLIDALETPKGEETETQMLRRKASQRKTLDRALNLDSRVDTAKKLADALRILIEIERQAFGITDKTPDVEAAGKSYNDAERASRAAALFQAAHERREAAERVAVTDVEPKNAA